MLVKVGPDRGPHHAAGNHETPSGRFESPLPDLRSGGPGRLRCDKMRQPTKVDARLLRRGLLDNGYSELPDRKRACCGH
jgi:hypothetical protein